MGGEVYYGYDKGCDVLYMVILRWFQSGVVFKKNIIKRLMLLFIGSNGCEEWSHRIEQMMMCLIATMLGYARKKRYFLIYEERTSEIIQPAYTR